jgi:outer membrane protein assembly factor BamB
MRSAMTSTGRDRHSIGRFLVYPAMLLLLHVAGCGGGSGGSSSGPAPLSISSLTPASAAVGGAGFVLTVDGSGFVSGTVVQWNGQALPTQYVSATSLTATVPAADIASIGTASVTVADATAGGEGSPAVSFPINEGPSPALTSLAPAAVPVDSGNFTLIVTGSNFTPESVVLWNGQPQPTTYDSSSQLSASIAAAELSAVATVAVAVMNDVAAGGTSNPANFNILALLPAPTLASITPTTIPSGTANVTLMATGTNYTQTALIYINGNAIPTTYVSATTLTATVPSTYLANQGELSITVADVASGDVPSGAQLLSVPAVLRSVSPSSITAGSAAFALTVSGTQFTATTVVYWNGTALPTTFQNSTSQLVAQVPSQDLANPTTGTVTVEDPTSDDAPSNGLPFTVQANSNFILAAISPTYVVTGGTAFTLTTVGSGFTSASVVTLGGTSLPTNFISSTLLTAQVSAAQIASAGTLPIAVVNPAGAGGTSSTLPLVVGPASKDAVSFQITAIHAGAISFNSVSLPAASAWTVNLGAQPSYAVIAGGTVFVTAGASPNSELIALNGATGATLWGPIAIAGGSNATYDNGRLFVLSAVFGGSGLMQAFDPATGDELWSTALTGQYEFNATPVAAQGIVATQGSGEGSTIYALNESNGAIAWTQGTDAGGFGTVALSVDGVYESQPCQTYDFSLPTGAAVWFQDTGCDGGGGQTPVVANGAVYSPIGSAYDGTLYAAETGNALGTFAADVAPAVTATAAYMLQSKTLRSIAVSNNQINWSFAGDGDLVTSPIVVNNYVFVGSSSGNLYALDATTGAQVWTKTLGAAISASPGYAAGLPYSGLAAGDGLLVVPNGTSVTAFLLSASP